MAKSDPKDSNQDGMNHPLTFEALGPAMWNYQSETRNISVSVEPIYLSDQSAPEDDYYVWAYKVEIENKGKETVQIRSRFWRITDAFGRTQESRGFSPCKRCRKWPPMESSSVSTSMMRPLWL